MSHQRGSGTVQVLILLVVLALGGLAAANALRSAVENKARCTALAIANLDLGGVACREDAIVIGEGTPGEIRIALDPSIDLSLESIERTPDGLVLSIAPGEPDILELLERESDTATFERDFDVGGFRVIIDATAENGFPGPGVPDLGVAFDCCILDDGTFGLTAGLDANFFGANASLDISIFEDDGRPVIDLDDLGLGDFDFESDLETIGGGFGSDSDDSDSDDGNDDDGNDDDRNRGTFTDPGGGFGDVGRL